MATNNDLEFLDTYTVEGFLNEVEADEITVQKTRKTGHLLFTWGNNRANVGFLKAEATKVPEHPLISRVKGIDQETGEPKKFWLMHEDSMRAEPVAVLRRRSKDAE